MKPESKVTWLSVTVLACALVIGGLGYYSWSLHRQVEARSSNAAMPAVSMMTPGQSGFDPFAGMWDPNGQFAQMRKHMDELMQQMMPGDPLFSQHGFGLSPSSPEVSLDEDSDGYTVVVKVPEGEDVELNTSLDDNRLTISGEVQSAAEDDDAAGNIVGRARSISQFSQTITLAEPVDESGLQVDRKGEEIVITIPKRLS